MDNNLFICTQDEETKDKLLSLGYTLIENQNGIWKFVNDKVSFTDDSKKVFYTNKLFI